MIFKLDTEKTIDKNLTLTDKELNGDIEELIRIFNYDKRGKRFLRFINDTPCLVSLSQALGIDNETANTSMVDEF